MHLQSRLDTHFNKDTHSTVLYFLVYDQDKEKQKEFKNVMSFRDKIVSTGQIYKPLAEKHKCCQGKSTQFKQKKKKKMNK